MSASVAIAISAFRSDEAVIELLGAIFADPHPAVVKVIVVDSLGSGRIEAEIAATGFPVLYENNLENIGSAGNLARRMFLAETTGAEWCLCLNHDANWSAVRLSKMLETAAGRDHIGAVYPVLDHSPRQPRWEDGRRSFLPSASDRLERIPENDTGNEVLWSSSNHALYALAPFREGIFHLEELWMMYEDLAYGIALHKGGWLQLVSRKAILSGGFDYSKRRMFGREVHIPKKPTWYSYYNVRNLVLIRRKYGPDGVGYGVILRKLLQSTARIMLLEDKKIERISLLYRGTLAGIAALEGKGPVP
jgi:GT2 family glycosyltransferase